jgi:hypothetical protein
LFGRASGAGNATAISGQAMLENMREVSRYGCTRPLTLSIPLRILTGHCADNGAVLKRQYLVHPDDHAALAVRSSPHRVGEVSSPDPYVCATRHYRHVEASPGLTNLRAGSTGRSATFAT